jgi:hypothetical protein
MKRRDVTLAAPMGVYPVAANKRQAL